MKKFVKIIVLTLLLLLVLLTGYSSLKEKLYYMDQNNYITEEVIVDNIIYENDYIVLWLSEIDELYSDSSFIIRGANASLALANGITEKIEIGDEIVITSAPRYFGDGYFMPIVHLSVGDDCLLSFEVGYNNLIESY